MKLRGGDRTPTSTSEYKPTDLRDFVVGLFPEAILQESFADRMVFSVPQQSVPSLANCFLQLEKGTEFNLIVLRLTSFCLQPRLNMISKSTASVRQL